MTITSREQLLKYADQFIIEHGVRDLDIRSLAKHANCAVGTIYYHFESKNDLMLGVYEYFWNKWYKLDIQNLHFEGSFIEFIEYYYNKELSRDNYCKKFLIPGVEKLKIEEIQRLIDIEKTLKNNVIDKFLQVLSDDIELRNMNWTENLTAQNFCEFVVESIDSALLYENRNFATLKEIIKRMMSK